MNYSAVQYNPSTCGCIEIRAHQKSLVLNLAKQQETHNYGVNRMLKVNENLYKECFAFLKQNC